MPEGELERVGHLQATAVHPDYRGGGLQRAMGAVHLGVIENMGATHVLCTVSPRNPVSLRNILANGFVIMGLKLKFEGIWRYIMYKNLLQPVYLRSCHTVIRGSDIEGQRDLLGKGYLGFGIRAYERDFEVHYAEPL
jgi:hypothetical protein